MMPTDLEKNAVPARLIKKVKPNENGRLEVAWRVYDALCGIPSGDLSKIQQQMIRNECRSAFQRYEMEGDLMHQDGLQGKRGFAAAKKQHLKELKGKKT
jgi:hypothetical protein